MERQSQSRTTTAGEAPCFYCGRPVQVGPYAWRRTHGWSRKGRGSTRRSGTDVAGHEYDDAWACDTCVHRLRHGIHLEQEALPL